MHYINQTQTIKSTTIFNIDKTSGSLVHTLNTVKLCVHLFIQKLQQKYDDTGIYADV